MYTIKYTTRMRTDIQRMKRRGKNILKLFEVLDMLRTGEPLPEQYRDQQLKGDLDDLRECHIESNWLLVYRIYEDELILLATATGTHADIFGE